MARGADQSLLDHERPRTSKFNLSEHFKALSARTPSIVQKAVAEAIATFALVFVGCGAQMVNEISGGKVTLVGVALAFGIVLSVMVYAIGHISGAHVNPAVTIASASFHGFPWSNVGPYIAGQLFGATLASFFLYLIFGNVLALGATIPTGSALQSLLIEIIATFFLMFVVSAVSSDDRSVSAMAGAAVGSTVLVDILFAGPISGASMNPARSLGPAIIGLHFTHLWVYIVGPLAGAFLGAAAYSFVKTIPENENGSV